MRNELLKILNEYQTAKTQSFSNHPLAKFIRDQAPTSIKNVIGEDLDAFIVKGSAGQSKWADSPWISVMDPIVTDTPESGYYVAYLFSRSMDKVALSLQLGTTSVRREFGNTQGRFELEKLVALIRMRVPEYKVDFYQEKIDLKPDSENSRTFYYQEAHAFGVLYNIDLPEDATLVSDLRKILKIYRLLTIRGGLSSSDEIDGTNFDYVEPEMNGIEDPRRHVLHRRIERNRTLVLRVKRALGCVCQVCGLKFADMYGEIGKGFIEAHHLVPVSELLENAPIRLDAKTDFAVLCANCHRMIHRSKDIKSVESLKTIIEQLQLSKRMKIINNKY